MRHLSLENLLEDKSTGIQVYIGNESPIQDDEGLQRGYSNL